MQDARGTGQRPSRVWVNIGCGTHVAPGWLNFDVVAQAPGVQVCDVTAGVPLPTGSCEVVYHSHVLEHLRHEDALPFLRECLRLLMPGGVLRVVVPDLEMVARLYLEKLSNVAAGDSTAIEEHAWMTLEMLDQLVRERSGGETREFLASRSMRSEFLKSRVGDQVFAGRDAPFTVANVVRSVARAAFTGVAGARNLRALQIGRFRLGGEVHQWMYDRVSLQRLLEEAGFHNVKRVAAAESRIPGWEPTLDCNADGSVYKPDSLFMECNKP